MSFPYAVGLGCTELDGIARQDIDVRNLRGHAEEPVTWVLGRVAGFVFCPSCRANAIFSKDLGNCFPTRFVVDQVGAHVLATIDRFLGQSRRDRDGQQVLWLDVKGFGLLRQLDVK